MITISGVSIAGSLGGWVKKQLGRKGSATFGGAIPLAAAALAMGVPPIHVWYGQCGLIAVLILATAWEDSRTGGGRILEVAKKLFAEDQGEKPQ